MKKKTKKKNAKEKENEPSQKVNDSRKPDSCLYHFPNSDILIPPLSELIMCIFEERSYINQLGELGSSSLQESSSIYIYESFST